MTDTLIKLRRSAVPGKIPSDAQLQLGEVAINTFDGKMFFKRSAASNTIIEVATTANGLNQFANTTSSQLASVITDETGTGLLVFNTSPALTSPVISGNTNFDSGTLFVDSVNDRVGIGVLSPNTKLQIVSSVPVGAPAAGAPSSHLAVGATTYGTSIGSLVDGSGYIQQQRFDSNTTIYSLLLNPNGGNIGIGTSVANSLLHLQAASSPTIRLNQTSTPTAYASIYSDANGTLNINADTGNAGAGESIFRVFVDNTERLRISANGNVGIGATQPNAKLNVSYTPLGNIPALGAAATDVAFGPATSYGMMFGTRNDGLGYIQQQRFDGVATSYSLALQPNGGNVGIGTASPATRLHVSGGTTTFSSGAVQWFTANASSTFASYGTFFRGGTSSPVGYIGTDGGGIRSGGTGENFGIRSEGDLLLMAGATERARMTANGYFQIGTTSAITSRLLVYDNNNVDSAIFVRQDGAAPIQIWTGASGAERMRITAGGNVGIGSSSPSYALDVQTSDGASIARFKDTDSIHEGLVVGGDTNGAYIGNKKISLGTGEAIYFQNSINVIRMFTNDIERMRLNNVGNLGIGNTAPTERLHVQGNIRLSGSVVDYTGSKGTASQVLTSDGDRSYWSSLPGASVESSIAISNTSPSQVLDSFSASAIRTAKYILQVASSTAFQSSEILLVHDGSQVYMTEYAQINTGTVLATIDADIQGGNVRVLVSPNFSNITVKSTRHSISV